MTWIRKSIAALIVSAISNSATAKLAYVSPEEFYSHGRTSASSASEVKCCVWYGKGQADADYCMKKARDTGYLMLWFLKTEPDSISGYDCDDFLAHAICRTSFIDMVNSYGYLILCCSEYDSHNKRLKDSLYGYEQGGTIYNEATGRYEDNKNGYPAISGDGVYLDKPPSLHLLKFDAYGNILFHVSSPYGEYDTKFSPYALRFPIRNLMHCTDDAFASWFKQYLDMYRTKEQISGYINAGGRSNQAEIDGRYEIFVTENDNPTAYQMALHRDGVMFRAVTSMRDIMIKERIGIEPYKLNDRCIAVGRSGRWIVNYDDTISALLDNVSGIASMDLVPNTNCTVSINQRNGTGFCVSEYGYDTVTNVISQYDVSETGDFIQTTGTNVSMSASKVPLKTGAYQRNECMSLHIITGRIYRITVQNSALFDVISTMWTTNITSDFRKTKGENIK